MSSQRLSTSHEATGFPAPRRVSSLLQLPRLPPGISRLTARPVRIHPGQKQGILGDLISSSPHERLTPTRDQSLSSKQRRGWKWQTQLYQILFRRHTWSDTRALPPTHTHRAGSNFELYLRLKIEHDRGHSNITRRIEAGHSSAGNLNTLPLI